MLELNEATFVATLLLNVDLGTYADALGSAQVLANGNFFFSSGTGNTEHRDHHPPARLREFLPNGEFVYEAQSPLPLYRTHRLRSLYSMPDQLGNR